MFELDAELRSTSAGRAVSIADLVRVAGERQDADLEAVGPLGLAEQRLGLLEIVGVEGSPPSLASGVVEDM